MTVGVSWTHHTRRVGILEVQIRGVCRLRVRQYRSALPKSDISQLDISSTGTYRLLEVMGACWQ